MGTMNRTDRALNEYMAIPLKGYISTRTCALKVAEFVTIPTGAIAVLFSCTKNFVALGSSNSTAATWPTDVDDGTGLELNPTIRRLDGADTQISVMLEEAGEISLRFFSQPT